MSDERQPDDHAREIGDRFIASLNHDIRTPLSGILGMTDLLLETHLTDEQREYTSTARLCADQLLEMLNSALEYTALSHGGVKLEPAEFHLPHTLESLAQEFTPKAEAKGLKLLHESNGVPDSCDIGSGDSIDLNTNGLPDECESPGNCDGDADVDQFDAEHWLTCLSGPDVQVPQHCDCANRDGDNDVDLRDISTLTQQLAP